MKMKGKRVNSTKPETNSFQIALESFWISPVQLLSVKMKLKAYKQCLLNLTFMEKMRTVVQADWITKCTVPTIPYRGRKVRPVATLEMGHTQRVNVGRRRGWMYKNCPAVTLGFPTYSPITFRDLRGHAVWEILCCAKNCQHHTWMVFSHVPPKNKKMARSKLPVILSSLPSPLTVWVFKFSMY